MAGDVTDADGGGNRVMEEGTRRKAREKYRRFIENLSETRREERNQRRREASKLMKTRKVNIGHQKPRWDAMKSRLGVRSDRDLAQILLSAYLRSAAETDQSASSAPFHRGRTTASTMQRTRRGRPPKQGGGTPHSQSLSHPAGHPSLRRARGQAHASQNGSLSLEVMRLNPDLDSEMKEDFTVSVMQLLPDQEPHTGGMCKQEMPSVQDSPSGQAERAEDLLVSEVKLEAPSGSTAAEAEQGCSAERKEVGGLAGSIPNRSGSTGLDSQKSSVYGSLQSLRLPSNITASRHTAEDGRGMVTIKVEPE